MPTPASFDECAALVLDFLSSKCLVESERALRKELEHAGRWATQPLAEQALPRNLWQSKLEKLVGAELPLDERGSDEAVDVTPRGAVPCVPLDAAEDHLASGSLRAAAKEQQSERPKQRHAKHSIA